MTRTVLVLLLLSSLAFGADSAANPSPSSLNLMPLPASIQLRQGSLKLDGSFAIAATSYSDARLERAIRRLQQRIEGRTGVQLPLGLARNGPAALTIEVTAAGSQYPRAGR